jgi:P-loop containing dynein motor region
LKFIRLMQKVVDGEKKSGENGELTLTVLFLFLLFPFLLVLLLLCLFTSNQMVLNINFSSRTTSLDVQRTIEAAVEKRTKNIFGPPVGKKLIAFVDDMNMPKVDSYGTQQPIAMLKLLIERGGMYNREKDLSWKKFKDLCK